MMTNGQATRNPAVDHPDYYNAGGIEVLDVVKQFRLNFCTGNALKYICRAGQKPGADRITDLRKAVFYLNREIEENEKCQRVEEAKGL